MHILDILVSDESALLNTKSPSSAKASTPILLSVAVETGGLQEFPREHDLKLLRAHAWLDAICNLCSLNDTREEIGKYPKVSDIFFVRNSKYVPTGKIVGKIVRAM